jgi:microcystin degradation protein MlrC
VIERFVRDFILLGSTVPGFWAADGPILGGPSRSFGPIAVLRVGGIEILIFTMPEQMLDLQQFRAFGTSTPSRSGPSR